MVKEEEEDHSTADNTTDNQFPSHVEEDEIAHENSEHDDLSNSDETEVKNKRTVIRSMSHHIKNNLERIGNKLKLMNEQERYDYFSRFISKLEKKMDYSIFDEAWKRGVVKGCIKLYGEKPDYLNDIKNHLQQYAEYEISKNN